MAHTKIAVGLLLACAICAHAFPADNVPTSRPSFGAGSSSFEPVKPLGGSSGPGSAGVFIPQGNPNFPTGTTAGRFVRDDQEAAARSPLSGTTVLPSSTRNTREVTNSPVKPLAAASTLPPRRDSRDVTSPRPVVLPGSLASSSASSTSAPKNKREEATTAKLPVASSTVAHRELREATTAKVIATGSPSLGAKPLVPTTAAPKNKK